MDTLVLVIPVVGKAAIPTTLQDQASFYGRLPGQGVSGTILKNRYGDTSSGTVHMATFAAELNKNLGRSLALALTGPGWIDVEAALPEEEQEVMCYSPVQKWKTGYRRETGGRNYWYFNDDEGLETRMVNPTHWMPLTVPPKASRSSP